MLMFFFFTQNGTYDLLACLDFSRVLSRSAGRRQVVAAAPRHGERQDEAAAVDDGGPPRPCLRRSSRGGPPFPCATAAPSRGKIGRAACRERVEISVVAGSLKKK